MLIPRFSVKRPDAPEPDKLFLKAVCDYLDPRRLVTTELFLEGPDYQSIFISVGISLVAGRNFSSAVVREQVLERLREFLAPVKPGVAGQLDDRTAMLLTPSSNPERKGWPLRRAVIAGELLAEVARVPGVAMVTKLFLAGTTGESVDQIEMQGLQLPRLDGIHIALGDPMPISALRGDLDPGGPVPPTLVPLPVIPKEC
jgi:hypothetical protein